MTQELSNFNMSEDPKKNINFVGKMVAETMPINYKRIEGILNSKNKKGETVESNAVLTILEKEKNILLKDPEKLFNLLKKMKRDEIAQRYFL